MSAKRQKIQLELAFGAEVKGEAQSPVTKGTEAGAATFRPESPAAIGPSMEAIVAHGGDGEADEPEHARSP